MFAASVSHPVRPVGVLLGGSGIRRIVEPKKPDVGVLLRPRTDLRASRSMPMHVVASRSEVDCHELDHERASALVIGIAKDDPELVLEKIRQLKQSGEIAPDELIHIEHIARQWLKIARDNLTMGRRWRCRVGAAVSRPSPLPDPERAYREDPVVHRPTLRSKDRAYW